MAGTFMRFLARFRHQVHTVERVMGLLLVVTGIVMLTGTMPLSSAWMLTLFLDLF